MIEPTRRFTAAAEDYARYRPDYPDALVDWVRETTGVQPPARIADLGAGTGISARRFAGHGYTVVGVEPNEAMRAKAVSEGGGPTYVAGTATSTGLADGSVALVVGCQAFHWFDLHATFEEIARICSGWVVAAWNQRTDDPPMAAYDGLLTELSAEYRAVKNGPDTIADLERLVPELIRGELPNLQTLDRAGLHGRADSSSYVQHGIADLPAFHRRLDGLFDAHAKDGLYPFTYRTLAVAWRVAH